MELHQRTCDVSLQWAKRMLCYLVKRGTLDLLLSPSSPLPSYTYEELALVTAEKIQVVAPELKENDER